jgi:hypothetical protein
VAGNNRVQPFTQMQIQVNALFLLLERYTELPIKEDFQRLVTEGV